MLKEATFVNGKYRKGFLVCQKWYVLRVKGLDLSVEPPQIKLR